MILNLLLFALHFQGEPAAGRSISCSNDEHGRVTFDARCLRNKNLHGCNAGGQGTGCRYCGFSTHSACPGDIEEFQDPNTKYTLFENDIVLVNQTVEEYLKKFIDLSRINSRIQGDQGVAFDTREQYNAVRNRRYLWSDGKVPYEISTSLGTSERNTVLLAMGVIENKTCVRFTARSAERDYVYVQRGLGCFSILGRAGGRQRLSLGSACMTVGTCIHELMHAIGFFHEQSRADRDLYVDVHWQNIKPGEEYNFRKYTLAEIDHLGEAYDYDSIMHYSPNEFGISKNSTTISPRVSNIELKHASEKITPSAADVRKINKLYGCHGFSTESPNTVTPASSTTGSTSNPPAPATGALTTTTLGPAANRHTARKPRIILPCYDFNNYCPEWASLGHCKSENPYTRINCRYSCGLCNQSEFSQ